MYKRIRIACILFWLILAQSAVPAVNAQDRTSPAPAAGANENPFQTARAIVSGDSFTCAITLTGTVKCWGNNQVGQLGSNSNASMISAPVEVINLSGEATAIALGERHACALLASGTVKCWGKNYHGQLGDGTTTDRPAPVTVSGLTGTVLAIGAGGNHTCAVLDRSGASAVSCWGDNEYHQLGSDLAGDYSRTPVDVEGLSAKPLSLGLGDRYSCALLEGQAVSCWGWYKEIGPYSLAPMAEGDPALIPGMEQNVLGLAAGPSMLCASVSNGIRCSTGPSSTTQDISGVTLAPLSVAVGLDHACAVIPASAGGKTGGVLCWGRNSNGQLGNGTQTDSAAPVSTSGLSSGAVAASAGMDFSCGLLSSGLVKCWGTDFYGQLGDGVLFQYTRPVTVPGVKAATTGDALALGDDFTCARTSGDRVWCWGDNLWGEFGDGTTSSSSQPTLAQGPLLAAIYGAFHHVCGLGDGNSVYCWGENSSGQVGDGTSGNSVLTPTQVIFTTGSGSPVTELALGQGHTCGHQFDGNVMCWGSNTAGQLGNGGSLNSPVPSQTWNLQDTISMGSAWDAACVGVDNSLDDQGQRKPGGVFCWGNNSFGKLGQGGSGGSSSIPAATRVLAGTHVEEIAAGDAHFCAGAAHGEPDTAPSGIYCWGYNGEGQFGNASTSGSNQPVLTIGSGAYHRLAAGGDNTCALAYATGGAYCWGDNEAGKIGDGSTSPRLVPTRVMGLEGGVAEVKVGIRHACAVLSGGTVKCWGSNSSGEVGQPVSNQQLTPVDVLDGPTPQVEANYPDGKSGSTFTLTGWNYPPNVDMIIEYGVEVSSASWTLAPQAARADTITTSEDGSFVFFLTTEGVQPGTYQVSVGGTSGASVTLTLTGGGETREQEGGGATFAMPTDIGPLPPVDTTWYMYLPSIVKK